MIEYRDGNDNLFFTGEFLEPNIIKVVAYIYRAGTVSQFMKDLIKLMEETLEPNTKYHTIWIYKENFYDGNMFSNDDLEESLDDLKYIADNWDRVSSISILENRSIGSKINEEMARRHLKDTTIKLYAGTEEEALQIVNDLNKSKNIV